MAQERETTFLDHERRLNDDELREIGQRLAKLDEQVEAAQQEKKLAASQWSAVITDLEKKMKADLLMLRKKKEWISVECEIEMDHKAGVVRYFSIADGDLVDSREMTAEERQMRLTDYKSKDQGQEQVHDPED